MYDSYEKRNKQLNQRCEEVNGLIEEIYKKDRFAQFGPDWSDIKVAEKCIVMGHSFGGVTAFAAASKNEKIGQVVSLDPWFFPAQNNLDSLKLKAHQRCLVIKAQHFNSEVVEASEGVCDQLKVQRQLFKLLEV